MVASLARIEKLLGGDDAEEEEADEGLAIEAQAEVDARNKLGS